MLNSDTIAAIATPPGEGGIAIVRLSGPDALSIAAALFRAKNGCDPRALPGYSLIYGTVPDAESGEIIDDGLLSVFRSPRSFTGEDTVELSIHGGKATAQRVLRAALKGGARLAEPGEFTQRALLNGRMDLAQAEAVADVIRAQTDAAQRMARRQLDGALSGNVGRMRQELIGILAAIEVTIDFSDEVGDLDYPSLIERIRSVRADAERLLATADRGRILREGLRVALIGRPNVGKSSLFNALLRSDRAIVTDQPGTTRDRLEETANVEGMPLVLIDVAGIRDTEDAIERQGVERAESALQQSDIVLFVLDASEGVIDGDRVAAARLSEMDALRVIVVLNKCDVADKSALETADTVCRKFVRAESVAEASALTGEGIPELERMLLELALGDDSRDGLGMESVVVSNVRHKQALDAAVASLVEAEQTAVQGLPGDFVAIDARGALDSLGLITGETVTDDIVHRIFKDFCVGK